MFVRMPIVGAGTPSDPRTVLLPTWSCITENANGTAMIVWVPNVDAPDDVDAIGTARYPIINGVPVLIGLTLAQRLRWRQRLSARWQAIVDTSQADVV